MKQLLFVLTLFLFSCGDDPVVYDDYREEFIGTYDCTKSNRGFDDDNFTTEVEVLVELDTTTENSILINGISVELDANGEFEGAAVNNDFYDLSLADGKIRWEVNVYFPLGLALPCYIQGELRD